MRKLIVGCGYLGERVATRWQAAGDQVYALTRSRERARAWTRRGWKALVGDITNPAEFPTLPDVDTVLYAVGYDVRSGQSRRSVTVDGLSFVLSRLSQQVGKLIYISTTSVYGQTDGSWVDESSPCEPTRENGILALQGEQEVRKHFVPDDPTRNRACILRLSGIYGPERLLARRQSLLAGNPLTGNPASWLNLIHVEDAVTAVLGAETVLPPGELLLVSDDTPIPRYQYYSMLARMIGAAEPTYQPSDPHDPQSGALNKRCRNAKLRKMLGAPLRFSSIAEGLPYSVFAPP